MRQEIKLKIGGVGISINWKGSRVLNWPHPCYRDFISDGKVKVNLRVYCDKLPAYPEDELIFDGEAGYWKLYRKNSGYLIRTYDTLTHKQNKVCFMKGDFSSGAVYVDSQADIKHYPRKFHSKLPQWSFPLLMQPLGQLLIVNVLSKDLGIMVHGLGINDRGQGIAFLGASGTGKSTLANFYKHQQGVNILSDEHLIIRKENRKFFLYGTPWPGMAVAASSQRVPLEKLFFIQHFSENKILSQATMNDLLPLLFLPFWDKQRIKSMLEFCEDLLNTIESMKLGFVKNKSVIEFVRKLSCKSHV
jgi:hypothetical protein